MSEKLVRGSVVDIHAATFTIETYLSFDQSEDRMILADPHTLACEKLRSALANDDVAGNHVLTAELLNSKTLACAIAPVLD